MQRFMPPEAQRRLKFYQEDVPLFTRFQIENQIESAYAHKVQLPSGGSIVIDYTEALVSIDINSARATRGSDIEATALNTNLEAADEIARQLRIRDAGGLIVIDFIDMESTKNQREVEDRLRDAVRQDRARIQIGRLSRFGLLEMSRQRLRPSLDESSHIACPRCSGLGTIRSVESMALAILRLAGEDARKDRTARLIVQVPVNVATYLMNEKRGALRDIEERCGVDLLLVPNPHIETPEFEIRRVRHDELGQAEQAQSSYKIPTPPPAPAVAAMQAPKPGTQVAAVTNIIPTAPAPAAPEPPPPPPPPPPRRKGLLGSLKTILFGDEAPANDAAATTRKEPAGRNERKGRDEHRGGRDRDRDRTRRGRDDRKDRGERKDRDGGRPRDKDRDHSRDEQKRAQGGGQQGGGQQRGEQKPRREQQQQQQAARQAEPAQQKTGEQQSAGAAPAGGAQEALPGFPQGEKQRSRRGGRRRRGRGGRGGEGAGVGAEGQGGNGNGSWSDDGGNESHGGYGDSPRAEPRPEPHPESGTSLRPDTSSPPPRAESPPAPSAPPPPPPPERPTVVWSSSASGTFGSGDRSQREE
jgi:ribonuclease E